MYTSSFRFATRDLSKHGIVSCSHAKWRYKQNGISIFDMIEMYAKSTLAGVFPLPCFCITEKIERDLNFFGKVSPWRDVFHPLHTETPIHASQTHSLMCIIIQWGTKFAFCCADVFPYYNRWSLHTSIYLKQINVKSKNKMKIHCWRFAMECNLLLSPNFSLLFARKNQVYLHLQSTSKLRLIAFHATFFSASIPKKIGTSRPSCVIFNMHTNECKKLTALFLLLCKSADDEIWMKNLIKKSGSIYAIHLWIPHTQ